jgi:hypothetical protein
MANPYWMYICFMGVKAGKTPPIPSFDSDNKIGKL